MSMELSKKLGLVKVREWLIENNPINHEMCFVHGDHHYANVLWRNYECELCIRVTLSHKNHKKKVA
jgi:thiamine kinase-like enzyme